LGVYDTDISGGNPNVSCLFIPETDPYWLQGGVTAFRMATRLRDYIRRQLGALIP
jgi:hypothetical protein